MRKKTIAAVLILSFLVPAAVLAVVFAIQGITPFGQRTLIVEDMRRQYLEIYGYYRRVFRTNENFFYSLSMGLGGDTIGLFSFLLSSPFLIPLVFLPITSYPTAISYIFLAKTGLCGLSFAAFALLHTAGRITVQGTPSTDAGGQEAVAGTENADGFYSGKISSALAIIALSGGYALSSYAVANIHNTMWIDAVAVFPLLALCHERMMEKESRFAGRWTVLYILCTAGCIYLNYYIAYMVLIFTAIRTLVIHTGLKSLVRCLVSTILGAGLVMALMLPTALSIAGSAKDTSIMEDPEQGLAMLPLRTVLMLLPGQYDIDSIFHGFPNIYCGLIPVVLFVISFFLKGISARRKGENLILFAVLFLSICIDGINRIWHAGMKPSGYLYRYSFLISFVILKGALEAADAVAGRERPRTETLMKRGSAVILSAVSALLCIIQLSELGMNAGHIMDVLSAVEAPSVDMFAAQTGARIEVWDALRAMDPGMYRAETAFPYTENDSMLYGNYGVTHYSSIQQTDVRNYLIQLGFNDTGLFAEYTPGNTHTADVLMGLKYCIYPDHLEEHSHVLPMAYLVGKEGPEEEHEEEELTEEELEGALTAASDPFRVSEELLEESVGEKKEIGRIFCRPEIVSAGNNRYELETARSGYLYMFIDGTANNPQDFLIYVNGEQKGVFGNNACRNVLCLGEFEGGSAVQVELTNLTGVWPSENVYFATEDVSAVDRCVLEAEKHAAEISMHSSSDMTVSAECGDLESPDLAVLIPYDESWHFYLDGRKGELEKQRFAGEFMKIVLPDNAAERISVTMKYIPRGLAAGIAISLLSAAAIALLVIRDRKKA